MLHQTRTFYFCLRTISDGQLNAVLFLWPEVSSYSFRMLQTGLRKCKLGESIFTAPQKECPRFRRPTGILHFTRNCIYEKIIMIWSKFRINIRSSIFFFFFLCLQLLCKWPFTDSKGKKRKKFVWIHSRLVKCQELSTTKDVKL